MARRLPIVGSIVEVTVHCRLAPVLFAPEALKSLASNPDK